MKKDTFETLLARALVLNIPREITIPFVRQFSKFLDHNGLEWTCARYKNIKLDFIRLKAGLLPVSPWVSREMNHFTGPIGGLQTYCQKNHRNWSKAIQLLQIYSSLISSKVTESQRLKFVTAVSARNESSWINHYSSLAVQAAKKVIRHPVFIGDPSPIVVRPCCEGRNEPHASGASFPEGTNTLECVMSYILGTREGRYLRKKYSSIFDNVLKGVHFESKLGVEVQTVKYLKGTVGKIGLIQEPGFKLRAVANPARVYQQALEPLGVALSALSEKLPWDCTHEQEKGFLSIQNHLSEGKMAHAIDLSNATDRFPLGIQLSVLSFITMRQDYIDLFSEISRMNWHCTLTQNGIINWEVGQPLGLRPSFPLFAITHGLVLYALNDFSFSNDFFVLGDDVVILNDNLYLRYVKFLQDVGVDHSPSKTLSSNIITEFGGKLILNDLIVPQFKWRVVSDNSFIDLMRNLGPKAVSLLRTRQRNIYEVVKTIPEFLGGCGHNPNGIPLSERYKFYLDHLDVWPSKSFLLSYNGLINDLNYQVKNDPSNLYSPRVDENGLGDFDLKSALFALDLQSRLSWIIPIRFGSPWTEIFGNPLYQVFPERRDVPLMGGKVVQTTLNILEKKFKTKL